MRLLYVALTRAKSLMILGLPSSATKAKTAGKTEHRPPLFKLLGLSKQDNLVEALGQLPSHLFAVHPELEAPYQPKVTADLPPIPERVIPRVTDNGPKVLSYTGLSRHLTTHLPTHASGLTDEPSQRVSIDSAANDDMARFLADGLPKGATFGIHVHALLNILISPDQSMISFRSSSGLSRSFKSLPCETRRYCGTGSIPSCARHYWMTGSALSKLPLKLGWTNWSFTFP